MSDYISREAVEQIIAAQCGECADACLEFDGIMPDCNQCLLYGAKKAIDSIPAADVRPVERGKWEHDEIGADICSVCQNYAFESSTHHLCGWEPNFCPNCGADMREDMRETDDEA